MGKKKKPTLTDLTQRLRSIKAKDIMTKSVIATTQDTPLSEVAEIMIKKRISGLPVIGRGKKLIGIITADDLFTVMDLIKAGDIVDENLVRVGNPTVKFAMSSEVFSITQNTTLDEIIKIMKYRNAHTIPVMQAKKMVGVIGRRDVFKNFYSAEKDLYLKKLKG